MPELFPSALGSRSIIQTGGDCLIGQTGRECSEMSPCKRPGLGPGQHICTPSCPEKWRRVQMGDGVNGGHTSRPGSGTARRTLDSVIVVGCHLPLFYLFAWGSLPLAGGRMGALWGLEGGYTPYWSQQSPNNSWSARSKKRDKTSTLRVMLPLKAKPSAKSAPCAPGKDVQIDEAESGSRPSSIWPRGPDKTRRIVESLDDFPK